MEYLKQLQDDPDEQILLVAFNGYRFDNRVLKNQITQLQIKMPLKEETLRFHDSMRLIMYYEGRREGMYATLGLSLLIRDLFVPV